MKPFVSIIVPVYNAENYINRCVDSILNQEYEHFELLLIDDGSTDSSPAILDHYAALDSRVRVIHQENAGVSAARNCALDLAKGDYLQFLDSDDWITPDATKLLVRTATEHNCDLVIADFYRVTKQRLAQKGDIETDEVMDRQEYASHMIENPADFYYGVLWNKLYRRSIIEEHHLRMDPSISWCEDFIFNLEYIGYAERFCALQAPIYYYVKRKGSLANQGMSIAASMKMKVNVFEYYNEFYKNVYEEEDYEEIRMQVYRFFLTSAKDGGVNPRPLPGSTKLGKEREALPLPSALTKEGEIMDLYRSRKLLEYHLESAATKNNLSFSEIYLLLMIHHDYQISQLRELAELTQTSYYKVFIALQRLQKKKLITMESKKSLLHLALLPDAAPILQDIIKAYEDFNQAKYQGFTDEEIALYESLSQRANENVASRLGKLYS